MITRTENSENKQNLKKAMNYLTDVDVCSIYDKIFDKVKFNRLNDQYRPLFNLAKLFYHNLQPGFHGGSEYTFTFLIPLNILFEYYVYKLFEDIFEDSPLSVNYQTPVKYLAKSANGSHFPLKPDMTLRKNKHETICILDTKFKNPLDNNELVLTSTDIYQIVTYAVRYKCRDVCLIYPCFKGTVKRELELAQFQIPVGNEFIKLSILQIDIMRSEKLIKADLAERFRIHTQMN